jgi:predicted O-methyltransferase YrrM
MLYALVRVYRPRLILELGTNVGISSSYLASAQQFNGGSGRLITCEASPNRIRLARHNHRSLGLTNTEIVEGLFSDTLDSVLESCGEIDFAFIDGHHQYQPTLDYFDKIYSHSSLNAVFVFDDIRWSEGMTRAWNEIVADRRLEVCFDLTKWGLGVRDPLHLSPRGAPSLHAVVG